MEFRELAIKPCEIDFDFIGMESVKSKIKQELNAMVNALLAVPQDYIKVQITEDSDNHVNSGSNALNQVERVFAYEFYHQWSLRYTDRNLQLNGETTKKHHGLDSQRYPDMVLHSNQANFGYQYIACEIKRGDYNNDRIKDFKALSEYKEKLDFQFCVFIIINITTDDFVGYLNQNRQDIIQDVSNKDIICLVLESQGICKYFTLQQWLDGQNEDSN